MKTDVPLKEWLPLVGMTCCAFVFNTSEFMPIGLLTDIASDFRVTEAKAGMLISVYAWFVAALSLPLMLLVSRMEYKKLLLVVIGVFVLSHVLSAVSTGYYFLMASRVGVACSHAVFWSIASPMAARVVSEKHRALALSMVVTGTSVAMIFGLPIGRAVGLHLGWRMTFLCVAVAAFLIGGYMAAVFPSMPSRKTFSLRKFPSLLANRLLLGIYLLTLLFATAYYTGYSYIEPFFKQVAGLPDGVVTFALTVFGAAGLVGSYLFSRCYGRWPRSFVALSTSGVAVALLLLQAASVHPVAAMLLCAFWGMAATAFSVAFQAEIIKCAPQDATAVAMSVFSGIFNLGIGSGTLLGGFVCSHASISLIGYFGGAVGLAAASYCVFRLLKLMKAAEPGT